MCNDLHDNTTDGCCVYCFQGIWVAAEVKDSELPEEENQSLFRFIGHLLKSVVDVCGGGLVGIQGR